MAAKSSTLPPEKLAELRQLVHNHVSRTDVQEKIRGCLSEALTEDDGRTLDESSLLQALENQGIVDQVMKTFDLSGISDGGVPDLHDEPVTTKGAVDGRGQHTSSLYRENNVCAVTEGVSYKGGEEANENPQTIPIATHGAPKQTQHILHKRCLFLQVIGGRAFIEHLSDGTCDDCRSSFTLHIHFKNQRYHSKAVPCSCEPNFSEGFLLDLAKDSHAGARLLSYADALSLGDPVHLVLTRTSPRNETETVGTCNLEWRHVLAEDSGKLVTSIELCGVGSESKIPAGLLDLKFEVLPHSKDEVIHHDILSAQLSVEKQRRDEKERLFLVYAKQWWREYLEIRPSHSQRLVKIFTPDETGTNHLVCSYVRLLRAGRLLDSPRHAARFVSLIPFEKTSFVGNTGSCGEVWSRLHTVLAQKRGACEDHAVLLCSLLLGFGLDAYVCVGTKAKGVAHTWVMTISYDGAVTFWESITGQRYVHPVFDPSTQAGRPLPPPSHPYRTMGCLFNHNTFYANTQPSDSVLTCQFHLNDRSLWKHMSAEAIRSVVSPGARMWATFPPLLASRVDPTLASNELETQLRVLTEQHRRELGLSTVWDDDLCYLLSPALSSYETERCLGVGGVGNEEFQDSIRNVVPDGQSFKGFPIQLLHRDPHRAFNACLRSSVCEEIFRCKGDSVRLAVRVRVFTYPEDVCAVWIMFAVKYQSIL